MRKNYEIFKVKFFAKKCHKFQAILHISYDDYWIKRFYWNFKLIDEKSEGVLNLEEIKNRIKYCKFNFKLNEDTINKLFNDMDIDKNGLVNYTEFVSALWIVRKVLDKKI